MLLSWLQTYLSVAIQARVVGSNHTFELWEKIHAYFQKLGRTKIRQLRIELRTTQLANQTVKEYLAKIKTLVDLLAAVGDLVFSRDHLDAILDGLPHEYDPIIPIVESRFVGEVLKPKYFSLVKKCVFNAIVSKTPVTLLLCFSCTLRLNNLRILRNLSLFGDTVVSLHVTTNSQNIQQRRGLS